MEPMLRVLNKSHYLGNHCFYVGSGIAGFFFYSIKQKLNTHIHRDLEDGKIR